jgi:hypothetical protein
MNRSIKLLTSAALIGLLSAPAMAQDFASQSTTGTGRIVQPITLTKNSDLAFGTVVKPTTGTNTIVIDATTGAISKTGGGDAALAASTSGRATYTAGGEGAQTFAISTPATFNMTSGANSLTVTLASSSATGTISGTLGTAGTATFGVGGSFPIASGQASGNYTGTFTTTVTYN